MIELSKEAKAARSMYIKQWNAKNKDKVKQYRDAYWERLAVKMKAEKEAVDSKQSEADNERKNTD